MAITLRTVTGSALSHNQLDTNFSSYFYSASISASVVSLHYTGSSAIGLLPRSSSITVPNSSKWTDTTGGGIARNSQVEITGSTNILGSTNIIGALTQGFNGLQAYNFSHAEGYIAIASGSYSHAEGYQTVTSHSYSHAEGRESITRGLGSHAEGYQTVASGSYSHAEGNGTTATGLSSHTEGSATTASGDYSHAEGLGTVASGNYQHTQGQYNLSSSVQSAFIIGNGASAGSRSNLVFAAGNTFEITGSLRVTETISGTVTTASVSLYPLTITGSSLYSTYEGGLVAAANPVGVIAIGPSAGGISSGSNNSIFLGAQAGYISPLSFNSNFIGAFAGASTVSASDSNFLGFSAGGDTVNAKDSNFFGNRAGRYSINASYSNFLGRQAGALTSASYSNFLGDYAGFEATNASNSNFFGKYAGWAQTGSSYSTFIGHRVADTTLGPGYLGSNNIIIGTSISLPAGTSNAINLGGVLFGTGTYSNPGVSSSGSVAGGRIGIGTATPAYTLDVSGSVAITNDLYIGGNKQNNYGAFQNNTTLSGSANVSHSFQLDTLDEASGVSVVSGSRVTFANSGTYNLQFSAQLDTPTGATVYIWFKKNGTNIPESGTKIITANNTADIPAWNFVKTLSAGDYVELVWQSNEANTTFPTIPAAGNIPICPSIIFTATQIR